jgi:outer membrane protein assembly factor BamB
MLKIVRSLIVVLLLCASAAASDWPQFRGPGGNGVSDARNVPIEWSSSENVAWKTPIPGEGWSSPVLASGKLYLTSAVAGDDEEAVSLRAICIDAADGRVVWNVETLSADPKTAAQVHTKNRRASSTPVVDNGRLFVHFGHMGTAALDLNGQVLWQQQRVKYKPVHGNGGSPALVDGLLVFSCDGAADPFVVALDQASGEERWRTPRNTPASKTFSFSTPIVIPVDGAQQVISAGSGFVGAYDPHDGREIWRVGYGEGYSVVPRPVFANGLLYVATGFNRARLLAIDPTAANGGANDPVVWLYERGVSLTPSLVVVENEVYLVADNGVASCLDARTGKVHWTERLEGGFSSSPVFAEGRVYFVNEEGTTYVVRADTTYNLLATNDLEEQALASPAVTDGAMFIRTAEHLWRIGK